MHVTPPSPTSSDPVTVVDLGDDRNTIDPTFVAALSDCIATALGYERPVVLTGSGKHWCTGLDLDWMRCHRDEADMLVADVHELIGRLLVAPIPTVAALSGHAFGAGAMLALACDERVMRADRGYICFPEVDLRLVPTAPMTDLVIAKLGRAAAARVLLSGSKFGAVHACSLGLVAGSAPADRLIGAAAELAAPTAGKSVATLATIKRRIWGRESAALIDARGSLPSFGSG
jgi:enoyl-CoA hydratase/carnithine racemase